jgi:hypothetical protein
MLAIASVQWGKQCHCDNGEDACALTMATMPSWLGQWHQLDDGNVAIAMRRATTLLWWQQRCLDCEDACALTMGNTIVTRATTPAWQQEDACAVMTTRTPLLLGWQHQLDDYASLTMAEMPLQQQQRRLHINGNNAITTRATTPLQWPQGHLLIDDDDGAIATRAMKPAWGWQQCHHDKGNNAVADQRQQHDCYKVNDAILTMATTSAHQQQQQCHRHEGKIAITTAVKTLRHCNKDGNASLTTTKGNNASSTIAETCLCINNSNNTIVMRVTIAIATMAKMPVHWWQQHQLANKQLRWWHWWWQQHHCNKGKDASLRKATRPSQQGHNTITDQGQQCHCYESNDTILTTARMPAHQQWQQCHCHEGNNCNGDNGEDACTSTATMPPQQGQ